MLYIVLVIVILAAVALAISAVVAYFNSGAAKLRAENKSLNAELNRAAERVSIAESVLIEIASGDAMPILRAAEGLSNISRSYHKGIK